MNSEKSESRHRLKGLPTWSLNYGKEELNLALTLYAHEDTKETDATNEDKEQSND